ncbi:Cys-Gln thioester bond-forming surface protein [Streptomyces sp. NPDC007172]|uniref:Cys-Gln thioester bond-forming surface protein n=1 Tax=Streptomyces sp. NPDC007172 TaxID=3364776 RepID=UPI00369C5B17
MFSAVHGPTARKRGALRLATATAVTGLVAAGAIAGAGTSFADDKPAASSSGVHATLVSPFVKVGAAVDIDDHGKPSSTTGGLFELKVDNAGVIKTYCIDLNHHTVGNATYKEVTWAESSLAGPAKAEAAGKINWILKHSYPSVVPAELSKDIKGQALTDETAAAATQAAIWTLSDDVTATPKDQAAQALTKYLLDNATKEEEPKASLGFDKDAVSGRPGEEVGPLTVQTNAKKVALAIAPGAAAGVQITDANGKVITSAVNGTQVYFKVPKGTADGSARVTASAQTTVPVGRAFVSDGEIQSQTFILASTSVVPVSAVASAKWADKGAAPAVSVKKDCVKGGLDVSVSNKGTKAFDVVVLGKKLTVPANSSQTVFVPVAEDAKYDFTIADQHFSGVLDCKTAGTGTPTPSSKPSPASAGGTSTGGSSTGTNGGTNLAETGSSSSTPMIAGAAVVLVLLGGGAVFFLRKKKTAGN